MDKESHFFYVLYCQDESLYAGYTNHLEKRLDRHNSGKGAKYTRPASRRPVRLLYAERWATKVEAMQAEWAFKQLKRPEKLLYLKDMGVESLQSRSFVMVNRYSDSEENEE